MNLNGISAVTCEVKTHHGKIAKGSVGASYRQMLGFLKYNKFI
jgi:predicted deacylase